MGAGQAPVPTSSSIGAPALGRICYNSPAFFALRGEPMPTITPAIIASVRPGSKAALFGLAPGGRVLRVNGKRPRDYIDYRYLIAEESVRLTYEDPCGRGAAGAVREEH